MPPNPIILAFDTAAAHCAAAVFKGDEILASQILPMAKGQAECLFPLIESTLSQAKLTWSDLAAIAVGTGPGNFTGIRISVSAARGLSLSLGIPAIGVSRLEAMAFGTMGQTTALIDARQNRIYTQDFENGAATSDVSIVDLERYSPKHHTIRDAALEVPSTMISTQTALLNVAQIATRKCLSQQPRPAPLYVRVPDAALPSDPPPTILP